jgi:hypothetical protein
MDDDNQLAKIFRTKLLRAVSNLFEHNNLAGDPVVRVWN